jgi:hypothetical protein
MEFSLPEFPSEPWPQAAFVAVVLLMVLGLAKAIFPRTFGIVLGLETRPGRNGGIGELRIGGGFLLGLSAATFLFDQPALYTGIGIALALGTFGRLLAMMSDQAVSLKNLFLVVIEAALAIATLCYFFDIVTPELEIATMPAEFPANAAYLSYAALAIIGAFIMIAPGLSMLLCGLAPRNDHRGGYAAMRSAGGMLLGASGAALLLGNPMLDLGMASALVFSVAGRLLALIFNRGNLRYGLPALAMQLITATTIAFYIFGMM